MSTGEKVVIGLALGVGALVVYKLLKPGAAGARPSGASKTNAQGDIVGGLVSAFGGFLGHEIGSSLSPSGPSTYGPTTWGGGATPVYGQGYTENGLSLNAGSDADNAQILPGDED
jgi:hypothetical protein